MKCSGKDTGPNKTPCPNEATTRNMAGHPVCKSCCEFSNNLIIRLQNLHREHNIMPIPFLPSNN